MKSPNNLPDLPQTLNETGEPRSCPGQIVAGKTCFAPGQNKACDLCTSSGRKGVCNCGWNRKGRQESGKAALQVWFYRSQRDSENFLAHSGQSP